MKISPLGKISTYIDKYDKSLLFPIERQLNRFELGIANEKLPFSGCDIWNAFELSWLNKKGKPEIGLGRFIIPCDSINLIESKSFKLYLNSFNASRFDSTEHVKNIIQNDLSEVTSANVEFQIYGENKLVGTKLVEVEGICLDKLDISCNAYSVNSELLCMGNGDVLVEETIYSNLLKTNCPVTGQPDWGTVLIKYKGGLISHEGLLKYIVSFRNHNGFHENCAEQIFSDIMNRCNPEKLTVYARYTRRGGLDINPIRSNDNTYEIPEMMRLFRQ